MGCGIRPLRCTDERGGVLTMAIDRPTDTVPELDASFYDAVPAGETAADHDFDSWWAEHAATRPTTTILGVTLPIPSQVPAEIMLNPDKALSLKTDDVNEMIRLLVLMLDLTGVDGKAALATWLANGLGSEQLIIIFTWALFNGMRPPGKPAVSFRRVAQIVAEAEQGKVMPTPANRAARRAAGSSRTAAGSKPAKAATRRTPGRR